MRNRIFIVDLKIVALLIPLVIMSVAEIVRAAEYHKWVDANGVTHYGQSLPAGVETSEVLKLADEYSTSSSQEYYSIQNQLARIEERKQERLKALAEKRARQTQKAPEVVATPVYEEPRDVRYYPVYPYARKKLPCAHPNGCLGKHPKHYYNSPKHAARPPSKSAEPSKKINWQRRE